MKPSRIDGTTRKLSGSAKLCCCAVALLCAAVWLQGCQHGSQQELKDKVQGYWENALGNHETLQFNSDGTLIMKSPRESELCVYDFPDAKHLRLDCAPAGAPARPQVWGFSISETELKISDALEVGVYRRKP